MAQHDAGPFALNRGAGAADRYVNRITLETLVRDHLDDAVERRGLHENPALRVFRRSSDQLPRRRRPRTPPDDLRIAGKRSAVGAKQTGRVVLWVRQQLGVEGAKEIG